MNIGPNIKHSTYCIIISISSKVEPAHYVMFAHWILPYMTLNNANQQSAGLISLILLNNRHNRPIHDMFWSIYVWMPDSGWWTISVWSSGSLAQLIAIFIENRQKDNRIDMLMSYLLLCRSNSAVSKRFTLLDFLLIGIL